MDDHPDTVREQRHERAQAALRSPRLRALIASETCGCDLRPAMPVARLIALGSGCHDRFVCPRLDRVRRAVGL